MVKLRIKIYAIGYQEIDDDSFGIRLSQTGV